MFIMLQIRCNIDENMKRLALCALRYLTLEWKGLICYFVQSWNIVTGGGDGGMRNDVSFVRVGLVVGKLCDCCWMGAFYFHLSSTL